MQLGTDNLQLLHLEDGGPLTGNGVFHQRPAALEKPVTFGGKSLLRKGQSRLRCDWPGEA
ncbi:hypothetical protein RM69_00215 [Mesotoga sp. SC_NapDC3]|nr:hypothetical protein RM69_00215 [Mesotoga sp. SC_NapDC3]